MRNIQQNKMLVAAIRLIVLALGTGLFVSAQTPVPSPSTQAENLAAAQMTYDEAKILLGESTAESLRTAMRKFKLASESFRRADAPQKQAQALVFSGVAADNLGDKAAALESFNQALLLFRALENKPWETVTLNNIGLVYDDFGEKRKALEYFNQALPLVREIGEKRLEATILGNIGKVYAALGEKQKALDFHNQSLPLSRAAGDKKQEAVTLNNIGTIYHDLDELRKAVEYYFQALRLRRVVGDKHGETVTLNNIGSVYADLKERQEALDYYNQVLLLQRTAGDKSGEARTLVNIGGVYYDSGEKQKALDYFNQALPLLRAVGDKPVEAVTLNNIGKVYDDSGEKQKALEYYQVSLSLKKAVGDKSGEAITFDLLMRYWTGLNNPRFAVFYGKQAVNLFQELRSNISTLDKEIQRGYLKSVESAYRKLADILIGEGRIAEAEEVLAMLKEEEFFAYLRRDDKVVADLKGKISLSPDEKKAFEDYEKFSDHITRTAQEFGALEKKKNDLPLGETLSAEDRKQYDALKGEYDAAVVVFNKFLNDLKIRFGTNDKRVAVVESDTQGILKRLNQPRTVIISTIVGEDRLNLIVTTTNVQRAHTIDIKAADLNVLVAEFRDAVKNPQIDPRPLGKKLYDTLFPAALRKDLDNIKADTIIWSLDGTLRYVPMAALWDGQNYLAERYTNAVLTLASRDKINAQAATDRTKWLALGVGVSKAASVKNADGTTASFDALSAVPQELCSVVADPKKKDFCSVFGKIGVIGGLMLPDDEFTLANFENNLGKVPVVHIASHFSLNAGDESDSYLLLGGSAERRFSLISLKKTRLDKVELLTLSACNTAMTSGANSSGVEIEGFGALAQNQGAKSVLATLWSVADDSTRDLMTEFYRELEDNPKIGKAEALRQAQIKLIYGKFKPEQIAEIRRSDVVRFGASANNFPKFTKDENAPFAHPFYWSPFVLSGNWQ